MVPDPTRRLKVLFILGFVVGVLALFLVLFKGTGGRLPLQSDGYTATAVMPDAFNLVSGSDVRVAGVKIGRVLSVTTNRRGQALVRMTIDRPYAPLYRNATIQLDTKTLVGENYLGVTRGNPAAGVLPSGSTLSPAATQQSVQLDQILSTLDPVTRRAVQRMLSGLGIGLAGQGQNLNALLSAAEPTMMSGARLMQTLSGERQSLASLIADTGTVMGALASRTDALRLLVRSARTTAITVAERDLAFIKTLRALPGFLSQARVSIGDLQSFSTAATPVLNGLAGAIQGLAPAVRDLRPTARSARQLFTALPPFLTRIQPVVEELPAFARAGRPAFTGLGQFDRQAEPIAAFLQPYARDIADFFTSDYHGYSDASGHLVRIFNYIDSETISALSPAQQEALRKLEQALGNFADIPRLQQNPYPGAGQVGTPQPNSGTYTKVGAGS